MASSTSTLEIFQHHSEQISFNGEQVIFAEGEPSKFMYGIVKGEVELIANGQTVERIGPGEVFGIDALLEEQPRPYTEIAALSESVLRQLPQKHERRLHRCGCWLL